MATDWKQYIKRNQAYLEEPNKYPVNSLFWQKIEKRKWEAKRRLEIRATEPNLSVVEIQEKINQEWANKEVNKMLGRNKSEQNKRENDIKISQKIAEKINMDISGGKSLNYEEFGKAKDNFTDIENNVQINLNKILNSGKLFNIVLTATGLGKTLGFSIWVSREILSSEKVFIWIRRTKEELKNTVIGMFRELLAEQEGVYITERGVYKNRRLVIYFIPLSLYYNYKSLTGISKDLAAIIYDEAIPVNKKWLDDNYSTEEEKFGKLTNILTRDKDVPFYFLCNPNAKGTWFIKKWWPNYKPSEKKEKWETKKDTFIYSKPWQEGKKRGVVDLLESIETQRTTKGGLYPESEDLFITNKQPTHYLYSFVVAGKEMEFGKRYDSYIISEAERERKNKKMIVFSRSDIIVYEGAILGDKKWYGDWWYNLLAAKKVKFNSHSIRDHFIYKTSMDFRW